MLETALNAISKLLFALISLSLFALSFALITSSLQSVVSEFAEGQFAVSSLLNNVSGIVISAAVLDLGKFLFEEEVMRGRDLRYTREVRQSITKFMSIILIAMSLEALVMVFEVSTSDNLARVVWPTTLFGAAILALLALGVFQWLTRQAEATETRRDGR